MSLFEEIQNKSKNKYIEISCAIESLAFYEGGIYKAVMVMLHYKFDELLCCFKQGKFYEFIDIDNDQPEEYSSFQILNDIQQYAESKGGINFQEHSLPQDIKEKIKGYYWNNKDFSNLEPIHKILNATDSKNVKLKKYTQQKITIPSISKAPRPITPIRGGSYLSSKNHTNIGQPTAQQVEPNIESLNAEITQLRKVAIDKDKTINELQELINQLESKQPAEQIENDLIDELTGLKRRNQLAQDRQGMARIIALSLWSADGNILIGDMANKVYAIMVDYCRDDLPQTPETIKNWIRPIATPQAQQRGRKPQNQKLKI